MARLPSSDEIIAWLRDNPTETARRDIARAFGLRGADKVELRRLLAQMARDGLIEKRARQVKPRGGLPPVLLLRATGPDREGNLWAEPSDWEGEGPAPRILVLARRDDPALGAGDRLLGRMAALDGPDAPLAARVIRRIGMGPKRVIGIFHLGEAGGRIAAIDKRTDRDWQVAAADRAGAREGELVEAEETGEARGYGLPKARVVARLGDPSAPKAVTWIHTMSGRCRRTCS